MEMTSSRIGNPKEACMHIQFYDGTNPIRVKSDNIPTFQFEQFKFLKHETIAQLHLILFLISIRVCQIIRTPLIAIRGIL